MPVKPVEFDNKGGDEQLQDWFFAVERTVLASGMKGFAAIQEFALGFVSRPVHEWFRSREQERAEEGLAPISSWADMRTAFAETYRKHNDEDIATKEFTSSSGMTQRAGSTLEQHLTRVADLRSRIPVSIIDVSAFNTSVINGLNATCARAQRKARQAMREYREAHNGASFSFTALREKLYEAHQDSIDAAPVAYTAPLDLAAENARLKAQLAQQGPRRHVSAARLMLIAARTEASEGGGAAFRYDYSQVKAMMEAGICFRCGGAGHQKQECDKPYVNLNTAYPKKKKPSN